MAGLDFIVLNYYLYLKSIGFSSDVEIGKRDELHTLQSIYIYALLFMQELTLFCTLYLHNTTLDLSKDSMVV